MAKTNKWESPYTLCKHDYDKNPQDEKKIPIRIKGQALFNAFKGKHDIATCLSAVRRVRDEAQLENTRELNRVGMIAETTISKPRSIKGHIDNDGYGHFGDSDYDDEYGDSHTRVAFAFAVLPNLINPKTNCYDNVRWSALLKGRFPKGTGMKFAGAKAASVRKHVKVNRATRPSSSSSSGKTRYQVSSPSHLTYIVDTIKRLIGEDHPIAKEANFEASILMSANLKGFTASGHETDKVIARELRKQGDIDAKYAIVVLDELLTNLTDNQKNRVPVLLQQLIVDKHMELFTRGKNDNDVLVISDKGRYVSAIATVLPEPVVEKPTVSVATTTPDIPSMEAEAIKFLKNLGYKIYKEM